MNRDSEVWLQEQVVPLLHAPEFAVNQDFTMLAAFSTTERTDQDWKGLLHKAGLILDKVQKIPNMGRSIIVAKVAEGQLEG